MSHSSKAYFEEVATRWDQLREEFFPESIREAAMDRAGVRAGESAADLGAGTGFLTEGLLGRGLSVVAVDQSPSMLRVLAEKFAEAGVVEVREGRAERLPMADESVDHAFANMYLHHVDDPAVAIAEMARVVRPGGTLVVTDLDTHDFEFLRTEHHDRWMGFEREQVRDWFREAGLTEVEVGCANSGCSCESEAGEGASISIFLARGKRPVVR